ncbi:UvrABC system protein C [Kineosporia sp. NBRC 101677]|uniref:excinuclease ABC subunit UvrC n=1 Tax=Kineosporia sp. NBRC 101677 TaxID=3032197 RepID=UPI0024A21495|nr:excinuclease ABC subunit UvrC [Kineosporia sp. NBRC 101677]GLY17224.1 UvrABC system protein C [Kineosporia sp. NBRC 101677]
MADPSTYRPAVGTIPEQPGVYRFRDASGRVIYVGKAKSLRQRLNSYFADPAGLHPRTQTMVFTAASVEWTTVNTEVEALQLEYSWIKEYDPRFNVKYRDDKSYPYLAVTMGEEFPRVQVMRGAKRKGTRYFGPYAHAWAIRETVDLLLRVFPVRTCSNGVFKRAGQVGRPCLLGYIDKCSAPCVGKVDAEQHRRLADDFCDFMGGRTERYVKRLERDMMQASHDLEFEQAARLRDDIKALSRAMEKNAVVLPDGTDADVFALADDELEAAVQVFHVRGGRIRGQRGWVVEKVEDVSTGDLVEHLLQQVYGDTNGEAVPREVLVPHEPPALEEVESWLAGLRGSRVEVRVPQRGDKRTLMETVARNAGQALTLHKTRRAGDLTTRSKALQEIQEALDLPEAPLRIECYDISHIQGSNVVASMVVFEDGLSKKSEYRKFTIKSLAEGSSDDVASIREVISRRFRRLLDEKAGIEQEQATQAAVAAGADPATGEILDQAPSLEEEGGVPAGVPSGIDPETGRPRKFSYTPNLVVVDGGAPQVAAAAAAMRELGIENVALCGLAKRLEEVWIPDDDQPVILPRSSEGLYLLQRVRDEAHRFAITHHRQRRSTAMTASELDAVPGLGPARKKALLAHFGSVKKLRAASVEAIASVQGVGPKVAQAVSDTLNPDRAAAEGDTVVGEQPVAVDMATGELLD